MNDNKPGARRNHRAAAAQIIAKIHSEIPSLEEISNILDDGSMGPSVEVPAVWLHIVFQHVELLELEAINTQLQRRSAQGVA
jgi:hypothetical protein